MPLLDRFEGHTYNALGGAPRVEAGPASQGVGMGGVLSQCMLGLYTHMHRNGCDWLPPISRSSGAACLLLPVYCVSTALFTTAFCAVIYVTRLKPMLAKRYLKAD